VESRYVAFVITRENICKARSLAARLFYAHQPKQKTTHKESLYKKQRVKKELVGNFLQAYLIYK
jgi:hypothetical protein